MVEEACEGPRQPEAGVVTEGPREGLLQPGAAVVVVMEGPREEMEVPVPGEHAQLDVHARPASPQPVAGVHRTSAQPPVSWGSRPCQPRRVHLPRG